MMKFRATIYVHFIIESKDRHEADERLCHIANAVNNAIPTDPGIILIECNSTLDRAIAKKDSKGKEV